MTIAGKLTAEQIEAIKRRERGLYGHGGDVAPALPHLREAMAIEAHRRLLPGFVRRYLEQSAPIIGIDLVGDLNDGFMLRPRRCGVLERLLPALEGYPESARKRFSVYPQAQEQDAVYLHPGEPVFEQLSALAREQARSDGRRGAIFKQARDGDKKAANEVEQIRAQQRALKERRQAALLRARREVELIEPGNERERYWLYAVFDCGTPNPRLFRVQDPFGTLFGRAQGSVVIGFNQIAQAARADEPASR